MDKRYFFYFYYWSHIADIAAKGDISNVSSMMWVGPLLKPDSKLSYEDYKQVKIKLYEIEKCYDPIYGVINYLFKLLYNSIIS